MLGAAADNIQAIVEGVGRDVVRRRYTQTGSDADPVRTPADTAVKAAIVGYSAEYIGTGGVQANDRKAYIAANESIEPTDDIVDGGVTYNIANLREVRPGDERFLYIAQLRA